MTVVVTIGTTRIFLAVRAGICDTLHRRITARGSGGLLKRLEAGSIEKSCSTLLLDRMVSAFEPEMDYAAAKDHVARVIAGIAPLDSVERFESLGVTVIEAWARFVSPTRVEAGGTAIEARRFVIATGSSPFVPPIPGLDSVRHYTNKDIFALRDKPRHLIVIGGGPIGIEMAQAHRRLGCDVTVIEGVRVLGREDPELAAIVIERLRAEGVRLIERAQAERLAAAGSSLTVTVGGETLEGSHLLVAVGRRVNLERLDPEAGGVKTTRAGVAVGKGLRSVSNRRVYAIGDVAGGMQFTHLAGCHGGLVIRNALFGLPVKARTDHIPRVTFTDPELAQVGLTEAEARRVPGDRIEVLRFGYDENDRARAELRTDVALVALAIWLLRDALTFETLRANRETLLAWRDANYLLAAAGYMLVYALVIALSLPGGAVMTLTGGFLFGLLAGTAMTVVAATTGAMLIFLAARAGFGDALHRRLTRRSDGALKRFEAGLRENAFNYLLMIRLVPAFPFWLVNLAPALLEIPLRTYVAATFLGIIPGTAVYTWVGAGLGEVFARGEEPDLGLIFDPMILGPILGLAALSVLPVVIRKLRGRGVGD